MKKIKIFLSVLCVGVALMIGGTNVSAWIRVPRGTTLNMTYGRASAFNIDELHHFTNGQASNRNARVGVRVQAIGGFGTITANTTATNLNASAYMWYPTPVHHHANSMLWQ